MPMIKTGECPFGSDIADILRDIRFRKRCPDVGGVIDGLRPRVIRIKSQPAADAFFDLECSRMIDGISIKADHFESTQERIGPPRIDGPRSWQWNILKCAVVRARYMRAEVAGLDNPVGTDQPLYIQTP